MPCGPSGCKPKKTAAKTTAKKAPAKKPAAKKCPCCGPKKNVTLRKRRYDDYSSDSSYTSSDYTSDSTDDECRPVQQRRYTKKRGCCR